MSSGWVSNSYRQNNVWRLRQPFISPDPSQWEMAPSRMVLPGRLHHHTKFCRTESFHSLWGGGSPGRHCPYSIHKVTPSTIMTYVPLQLRPVSGNKGHLQVFWENALEKLSHRGLAWGTTSWYPTAVFLDGTRVWSSPANISKTLGCTICLDLKHRSDKSKVVKETNGDALASESQLTVPGQLSLPWAVWQRATEIPCRMAVLKDRIQVLQVVPATLGFLAPSQGWHREVLACGTMLLVKWLLDTSLQ